MKRGIHGDGDVRKKNANDLTDEGNKKSDKKIK
jgi:hypothetical protein